ncbi:MAG: hypothetical protein IKC65_05840 [Lentisphaeria bacterium]|nr:hypothetical protein [Lentisphaeria bacterium]
MSKRFFLLCFLPLCLTAADIRWESVNFPVEWIQTEPAQLSLAHGKAGKVVAARGKDGSLAVVWGGRGMFELKGLTVKDRGKLVCTVKRFMRQDNRGWSAALLGCYNSSLQGFGVNLYPGSFRACQELPKWMIFSGEYKTDAPWEFVFSRNTSRQLILEEKGRIIFQKNPPQGKPCSTIRFRCNSEFKNSFTLIEFAVPRQIEPVKTAVKRSGPQKFPKVLLAHSMLCFRPGDDRDFTGGRNAYLENTSLITPIAGEKKSENRQFFLDMQQAGVDAVNYCLFRNMGPERILAQAEDARKSGSGVRVMPCMDNMGPDGKDFLRRFHLNQQLSEHPSVFRVGRRPVVITFGTHPEAAWRERIERFRQVGGDFFIITDLSGVSQLQDFVVSRVRKTAELADGMYGFLNNAAGLRIYKGRGTLPAVKKFASSLPGKKVVGVSVLPGFISTTRVGSFFSPRGTEAFRLSWLEIIRENPDFVHLTTNNDYTESEMECSSNSTFSFIDLNRYFSTRWKTGKFPAAQRDQVFLSYRKGFNFRDRFEVEVLLLRPEITGREKAADLKKRFGVRGYLLVNGKEKMPLEESRFEFAPGHVIWILKTAAPVKKSGFAEPYVALWVDNKALMLPAAGTAPAALLEDPEPLCRKYLNVPLHRLRPGKVTLEVISACGSEMIRRVRLAGLPDEKEAAGGILERWPNPFHCAKTVSQLREGVLDMVTDEGGWSPNKFENGYIKRCMLDQLDRYTAVIRYRDNTFAYARCLVKKAPRPDITCEWELLPAPAVQIGKKSFIRDTGPRRRLWPAGKNAPELIRDPSSGSAWWHFNGKSASLTSAGALNVPVGQGTLEVVFRPLSKGRTQFLFESYGAAFSLCLFPDGTLHAFREGDSLKDTWVHGTTSLEPGRFHYAAVTFDGEYLRLFVNGKEEGKAAFVPGFRSDERAEIGYASRMGGRYIPGGRWVSRCDEKLVGKNYFKNDQSFFHGDLALLRMLNTPLTKTAVAERFSNIKKQWKEIEK